MARETGKRDHLTIERMFPSTDREMNAIPWPGGFGGYVGVMHLNCQELQDAHVEARALFRKRAVPNDMWSADELENEEMVQQAYRMLLDPEDRTGEHRIFKDAAQARARLSRVERAYFCTMHEKLYGEQAQGLDIEGMLKPEEPEE